MNNQSRTGRRYDREFKNNAVALVRSGRTVTEVARDLGVSKWSLGRWVEQAKTGQALSEPKTLNVETVEQRELRRLRQGLEYVSRQRDILKKALGILSAELTNAGVRKHPVVWMNNERTLLAVNGTLMRGLELNPNMIAAGAEFVREDRTVPAYRLYSINDRHPGMVRVPTGGVSVAVEIWSVPPEGLASILLKEPAGLSIGKVSLESGEETLGVLAEPILCEGQREITRFGGWREYCAAK